MFLCRENELRKLNKRYALDTLECVIIYGRRRVGKTALINEFVKDKPNIFFPALRSNAQGNLAALSKAIYAYLHPDAIDAPVYASFDAAFAEITRLAKDERIVFVIDELPYLVKSEPSIASMLQHLLDHEWSDTKLYLILCGSSMSFMEKKVLSEKSPLFGRRTAQLKIEPLTYLDAAKFHPELSPEENALIYGITGGVPHYINKLNVHGSVRDALLENLFDTSAYLFEEPENLLKQELREPAIYNSIITAIADGATKLNQISDRTGNDTSICTKYLNSLVELGIVQKSQLVIQKSSKKTTYHISDPFFRFWFRFVPKNMMAIASDTMSRIYDAAVDSFLPSYMGLVFEGICKQYLIYYADELPIKDDMITSLMDFPRSMILSIDIVPLGMSSALRIAERAMMSADANATSIRRWQFQRQDYDTNMPYLTAQMQRVGEDYMDDLTERDQHMMFGLVTLTHLADSMDQLDQDTESLKARAGNNCQFATLCYQQEDGFNTVLPYGLRRIDATRTLTTRSTAILMPFRTQEIQHKKGLYYGINAVSHNLIFLNRKTQMNGNGIIIGLSGSGKSMGTKYELLQHALTDQDCIIIVDPEREYGELVRALGGEIITLSPSSSNHINALDMPEGYGEIGNPLGMKLEFILSLCQQIIEPRKLDGGDRSVISRCTTNIYREYIKDFRGDPPTLKDLREDLLRQKEPVAHEIALALEMFTDGSLNHFSHQTNVNTNNRIICYDIHELGDSMKRPALLIMLDAIWNRVVRNRAAGRFTHIYIDEIYLFFSKDDGASKNSASFLWECWKRCRKYYATLTGITQNVEDCLNSDSARGMIANSEFLMMLNQAPSDRAILQELLKLSDEQMSYVKDSLPGQGLLKVGGAVVPFIDELPTNTSLYRMMTTKPEES